MQNYKYLIKKIILEEYVQPFIRFRKSQPLLKNENRIKTPSRRSLNYGQMSFDPFINTEY